MGDFQRARHHRRQHRVEIERGGNRAADFLEHLKFVDRAREVARARLHLRFEAGIGLRKLPGHAVELVGQFLQLVLGPTSMRWLNRRRRGGGRRRGAVIGISIGAPDVPARSRPRGRARSQRTPHQLVADRRQRLRGRLLEQHVPAEFRHRARCGQHPLAVKTGAGGQRHAVRLSAARRPAAA